MKKTLSLFVMMLAAATFGGCSTAPHGSEAKESLHEDVNATLDNLKKTDNTFDKFLTNAYGYVVFSSVSEGGLIVGGAHGQGEVYEQGKFVGYADISKASIGAQIGGQSFAEVLAFEDAKAMSKFKEGGVKFDATASAVALTAGAAATARYTDGIAVFIQPKEGLMAQASIGGQSFRYQPVMH